MCVTWHHTHSQRDALIRCTSLRFIAGVMKKYWLNLLTIDMSNLP